MMESTRGAHLTSSSTSIYNNNNSVVKNLSGRSPLYNEARKNVHLVALQSVSIFIAARRATEGTKNGNFLFE